MKNLQEFVKSLDTAGVIPLSDNDYFMLYAHSIGFKELHAVGWLAKRGILYKYIGPTENKHK